MSNTIINEQLNNTSTSVIVGMSGGVDSSVSAYLLKQAGYKVCGITMLLCEGLTDKLPIDSSNAATAARVAEHLGIDFRAVDYRPDFKKYVIEPFIDDYENGRTPNPCVQCNKHLKFGKLLYDNLQYMSDCMHDDEEDTVPHVMIATGHYAEIQHGREILPDFVDENCPVNTIDFENEDRWLLAKSRNASKDQSYFLYTLSQDTLSRIIFPLADLDKDEVRKIAEEQGLVNSRQKDSQDICFIPDGDYCSFIQEFTGGTYEDGNFVDMNGNILGRHKGIIKYTVGQRRGLGLALKRPMYVHHLDTYRNEVVLSDNDELFRRDLLIKDFNWVSMRDPADYIRSSGICYECDSFDERSLSFRALGRIRYRHQEAPCTVTPNKDGTVSVLFDEPQRAVTSGQSFVLYDMNTDNYVLGGGIII